MKKAILLMGLIGLSIASRTAQNKRDSLAINEETIRVEIKKGANPDVYIDGTKHNKEVLDFIAPSKIESVTVLKGNEALNQYYSKEEVIVIKTKTNLNVNKVDLADSTSISQVTGATKGNPLVLINGIESDSETLKELNPDIIKSISVLKDESAKILYGARGANGVVLVTTKSAISPKK